MDNDYNKLIKWNKRLFFCETKIFNDIICLGKSIMIAFYYLTNNKKMKVF